MSADGDFGEGIAIAKHPHPHLSISPGIVETEFAKKYHQSTENAQATYSQFEALQAEDIANAVIYVLHTSRPTMF